MTQGQGEFTEDKIRGFRKIFTQNLAVYSRWKSPDPYIHIDLHAGSGFNHEVNVKGSPVIFAEAAIDAGCNWIMFCCEVDKGRCKMLGEAMRQYPSVFPFYGNNDELCMSIPDRLNARGISPRSAVGTVLVDPNGFASKRIGSKVIPQIPWEGLKFLFSECPKLDCLFNYPGTAMQRVRDSDHCDYVHIDELPGRLNKRFWSIREPLPRWKFTAMVGRNTNKVKQASGFTEFDSKLGVRRRMRCCMTSDEFFVHNQRGQKLLF